MKQRKGNIYKKSSIEKKQKIEKSKRKLKLVESDKQIIDSYRENEDYILILYLEWYLKQLVKYIFIYSYKNVQ